MKDTNGMKEEQRLTLHMTTGKRKLPPPNSYSFRPSASSQGTRQKEQSVIAATPSVSPDPAERNYRTIRHTSLAI
jgi:hypothetical protein